VISKVAVKAAPSGTKEKDHVTDEASDAWEAAQHILQAINFGSLQTTPQLSTLNTTSNSVAPPVMASLDFNVDLNASTAGTSTAGLTLGEDGLGRATLTDEERASLQAQLALLAAQLSELALEGDEPAPAPALVPSQPPAVQPHSEPVTPQATYTVIQPVLIDINQFPEHPPPSAALNETHITATTPVVDVPVDPAASVTAITAPAPSLSAPTEEESDEDEDMEMVDVDSFMQGLRT
jgi:hypothetical protein